MIIFSDLLKMYVWMKHLFSSVSVREFPAGQRDFLFSKRSKLAMLAIQPAIW
jgi:hypothetical protein